MRDASGHVDEHHVHLPADQVGNRWWAAFVGHVQHVHIGHQLEKLRRQMGGCALAGGSKRNLPRCFFRQGDQLIDRVDRQARVNNQNVRNRAHQGDGRQVFDGVIAQLAVQGRVDGDDFRSHQQRIAIWRGLCHGFSCNVAASPRTVFNQHRLTQGVRQFGADDARKKINRSPRWKRNDDLDGLHGKGLCVRRGSEHQRECGQCVFEEIFHGLILPCHDHNAGLMGLVAVH